MTGHELSRRRFLHALALGAGAVMLEACAPAASPSPSAQGSAIPSPSISPPATSSAPASSPPTPGATVTPSATAVASRTLREKIASMVVVGFRGFRLADADWVRRDLTELGLGGVILFDHDGRTAGPRNVESPAQVAQLTHEIRALGRHRAVIVAIDQEGGIVTRLSPRYGFPKLVSQATIGEQGVGAVQTWAEGLVATLATAGVNLNLAPVVDMDVNPDNPAIGALGRAFSASADIVSRDAAIEVEAHRARGVRTALKHFPGIGSATVNTDFGVADVTSTWTDAELDPYRALLSKDVVDAVMVGHVVNGQIDALAPASLSRATVEGVLRNQLGFGGVVVTDDLQAAAITTAFGADDAVLLAIEAGCDLLLFANQQVYRRGRALAVVDLVEQAVRDGRITEARIDASVDRLDRLFGAPA